MEVIKERINEVEGKSVEIIHSDGGRNRASGTEQTMTKVPYFSSRRKKKEEMMAENS